MKKKNQIGFFNANDAKCKANIDDETKEQENQQSVVPPHIVNEIEEHVLAKQEYENSMRTLYLFKQRIKIALVILAFIVASVLTPAICWCYFLLRT